MQGHAKLGASERSYGGGLNFNISNDGTNRLGLNYTYIEGRHGIADDKRVELGWTYGFGAVPASNTAAMDETGTTRKISPAADVVAVARANNLLGDVMKRPEFLPKRVLARAASGGACPFVVVDNAPRNVEELVFTWESSAQVALWLYQDNTDPNAPDFPTALQITLDGQNATVEVTPDDDPFPDATAYAYRFPTTRNLLEVNGVTLTIQGFPECTTLLNYDPQGYGG